VALLAALAWAAWREARVQDYARVERWAAPIVRAARAADLDPFLLAGLVYAESRGKERAVSSAGAQGLCQVKPATAREVAARLGIAGEPPYAPADNLRIGADYLRRNADAWDGDLDLGLLCYRLGPGRVAREVEAAGDVERFLTGIADQGPWAWRDQILLAADAFRARAAAGSAAWRAALAP
jgi:soluble lytic murein transglycosylase-like protein